MKTPYEEFLEETANSYCTSAPEFNNRANAMMELGRYLEAQRDYNRACTLEPDEPVFFLNRAELFIELGMIESALNDAAYVRRIIDVDGIQNMEDMLQLAGVFHKCKSLYSAAEMLLCFLKLLRTLIPFTTKDNKGGFVIRKDKQNIHMSNLADFDEAKQLFQEFLWAKECEDDGMIKPLIEEIKREIYDCRTLALKIDRQNQS